MIFTNQEYAEMAIKANKKGKELKCENGKLVLVNPETMSFTDEQIIFKISKLKNRY